MPFYELVFITRQELTPVEVDNISDKLKSILQENGGNLVNKEYWGLKPLAYPIKKNTKGHYVLFNIDSPYLAVQEVEKSIKFNENIIRKGIFSIKKIPEAPSELMVSINAKRY